MKHIAWFLVACGACGSVESATRPDAGGGSPDATSLGPDAVAPDAAPTCGHGQPVHDTMFVSSYAVAGVEIFDCFSQHASGGSGGERLLVGSNTGFTTGWYGGLAVDAARDTLYVSDHNSNTVRVWSNAGSVDGNVAPDRVLTGVASSADALAYDPVRDLLYVGDYNNCNLNVYGSAHTANGAVVPVATITNAACWMFDLDVANDRLYSPNGAAVAVYDHISQHSGTVTVTPDRTIAPAGYGAAIDPTTNLLYTTSRDANGTIYTVANGSTASGTVQPLHTIVGGTTAPALSQVMEVRVSSDHLFAINDGSSAIFVFDNASTVDGAATPSRAVNLGAMGGTAAAIEYVP